jgi:hypothetical protein
VLTDLCHRFINRVLLRVRFLSRRPSEAQMDAWRTEVADWLVDEGLVARSEAEAAAQHYLTLNVSRHTVYDSDDELIGILGRDGTARELSEMADTTTISELTGFVEKPYVCFPKPVDLDLSSVADG